MKHLLLLSLLLFACIGYAQTEVELIDKQSDMEGTPRRKAFPYMFAKKIFVSDAIFRYVMHSIDRTT